MPAHPIARALTGALVAGAAGLAYAGLIERNAFTVRRFDLPVLPPGTKPIRILQISDLHLVPGQDRKIAWVRDLARFEPDLVVDTGDNLSHLDAVPPLLRALEPLLERPGLFVLGSNDYYAPTFRNPLAYLSPSYAKASRDRPRLPVEALKAGLGSGGWVDLDNARTTMTVAGSVLEFVGVDDPHIGRDRYADVAGRASDTADLTVGIAHAPYQRVLDAMTADGAGLVLAGHTHGGQVALPVFGTLVTNCDLDRRRAKGVSRWWPGAGDGVEKRGVDRLLPNGVARPSLQAPADAAWLHVSAGLGTSRMAPVRFACRPEASLLTLVSR